MPRGVKKENLPSKICVTCERPFTWRKKWERCWDEVTTCSKSCNQKRRQQNKGLSDDDETCRDENDLSVSLSWPLEESKLAVQQQEKKRRQKNKGRTDDDMLSRDDPKLDQRNDDDLSDSLILSLEESKPARQKREQELPFDEIEPFLGMEDEKARRKAAKKALKAARRPPVSNTHLNKEDK